MYQTDGNVQYVSLLPPRKAAFFMHVDGEVRADGYKLPEIMRRPLYRDDRSGTIEGRGSGVRSGLLDFGEETYKIKSCRPRKGDRPFYGEVYGGQTLSRAEYEAGNVEEAMEIFSKAGLPYPMRPAGFYVYGDFYFRGEPCAATIYRTTSDRRLDELLACMEEDIASIFMASFLAKEEPFRGVFERLGILSGRALRTLHNANCSWDWMSPRVNAYDGNMCVFSLGGQIHAVPIDMDNFVRYAPSEKAIMKRTQKFELGNVISYVLRPAVRSGIKRTFNLTKPIDTRSKKLRERLERTVGNDDTGRKRLAAMLDFFAKCGYPTHLRKIFVNGMKKGYRNPDTECALTTDELLSAKLLGKMAMEELYPTVIATYLKTAGRWDNHPASVSN